MPTEPTTAGPGPTQDGDDSGPRSAGADDGPLPAHDDGIDDGLDDEARAVLARSTFAWTPDERAWAGPDEYNDDDWAYEEHRPRPQRKVRTERRHEPVLLGQSAPDLAIWAIALAAGVTGALAGGQPTGLGPVDTAMRAAFAFGVAFVTPRARRWSWLVLGGVAAATALSVTGAVLGWSALAVAIVSVVVRHRQRWVGAVVGALAVSALLRATPYGFHGLSALVAVGAVLPVAVSAYNRERFRVRRRIRRVVYAVVGVAALATVAWAAAGALSYSSLDTGAEEARAGINAAKRGDRDVAEAHLRRANESFASANAVLDGWLARPARLVPVVAFQADTAAAMSAVGRDLTASAIEISGDADYRGVAMRDGRIDLDGVAALEAPLAEVQAQLVDARRRTEGASSPWLVGPLAAEHGKLQDQIVEVSEEATTALEGVRVAPGMLGAGGARRYFVAFTTPAEARGLGGFMGNWLELTATDGDLEISRSGRIAELVEGGTTGRTLSAPPDYLARYGGLHPEWMPGDATFSPDFPSDAQALASIYPQTIGGGPVDGVMAVDPYGLAAMLKVTGPITISSRSEPLTADNAADYLLREQYVAFDEKDERIDALDEAARATFDAFIHARELKPSALAETFARPVAERRLVAFANDVDEEAFLFRIGLDGAFPTPDGHDFFSLVTQNGGNNKIDVYLRRKVEYQASFDPGTGAVDANALVTLHNDAPASGLPDYVIKSRDDSGQPPGTNWLWFNFYSPLALESATLDGRHLPMAATREFGLNVYAAYVAVPPGGDARVALHLKGEVDPSSTYRVSWFQQPLTHPDDVDVNVIAPNPWVPRDRGPTERR